MHSLHLRTYTHTQRTQIVLRLILLLGDLYLSATLTRQHKRNASTTNDKSTCTEPLEFYLSTLHSLSVPTIGNFKNWYCGNAFYSMRANGVYYLMFGFKTEPNRTALHVYVRESRRFGGLCALRRGTRTRPAPVNAPAHVQFEAGSCLPEYSLVVLHTQLY